MPNSMGWDGIDVIDRDLLVHVHREEHVKCSCFICHVCRRVIQRRQMNGAHISSVDINKTSFP